MYLLTLLALWLRHHFAHRIQSIWLLQKLFDETMYAMRMSGIVFACSCIVILITFDPFCQFLIPGGKCQVYKIDNMLCTPIHLQYILRAPIFGWIRRRTAMGAHLSLVLTWRPARRLLKQNVFPSPYYRHAHRSFVCVLTGWSSWVR